MYIVLQVNSRIAIPNSPQVRTYTVKWKTVPNPPQWAKETELFRLVSARVTRNLMALFSLARATEFAQGAAKTGKLSLPWRIYSKRS